jgi:hypothetical protein
MVETIALTQPLAVEPLRWGLRGVAAQCFVVNRIFKILLLTQLTTNNSLFRTIFSLIHCDFYKFLDFLLLFYTFFSKEESRCIKQSSQRKSIE